MYQAPPPPPSIVLDPPFVESAYVWPLHRRVAHLRRKATASFAYRTSLASVLQAVGLGHVTESWFAPPPECRSITERFDEATSRWDAILAGPWRVAEIQAQTDRAAMEAAFDGMELLLDEAPWESWVETNGRLLHKQLQKRFGPALLTQLPTHEGLRGALPWMELWIAHGYISYYA